jgi:D-lactate dehydrogenase (quinone)
MSSAPATPQITAAAPLPADLARTLADLLGAGWRTDPAECLTYGYDNSRRQAMPAAVALPATRAQVQALVRACRAHRVPIVARGRGTNTTGAAVPDAGGVVVSFERMQRIIDIRPGDRCAVVEPGVLNGDLQRALRPHGLFWPPDPTSADFSSVGGNLACNAGGPRAVKYGASRDNVLALTAVAGTGELLTCGTATTKGSTGYDLQRLLVGSEGTLALIVEATLKLTPLPAARVALRAVYADVDAAAAAVARLMAQPVAPSMLEFMDGDALALRAAASGAGCLSVEPAADDAARERLWAARKALSPALRALAPGKINEDVVVPVSRIPELVRGVRALAQAVALPIVCFGHAGNGNLHVNLMYDPADADQRRRAHEAMAQVFALALGLGGTLSGEHGIGTAKRDFMPQAVDAPTLAMMRAVKAAFDPDGILNPGKLLPD